MKNKKCYVLTVSKNFPSYHPKKGENTGFVDMIMNSKKIHTIRGNYELWKKRIDEVNEGKAYISLRYWSDQPYKSKQVEFLKLYKFGYQSIEWNEHLMFSIDGSDWDSLDNIILYNIDPIHTLSRNDGLSYRDFYNWFKLREPKPFSGIIIHFTDFKY